MKQEEREETPEGAGGSDLSSNSEILGNVEGSSNKLQQNSSNSLQHYQDRTALGSDNTYDIENGTSGVMIKKQGSETELVARSSPNPLKLAIPEKTNQQSELEMTYLSPKAIQLQSPKSTD